ncbi:MAG: hypothetical protein CLLPBCKN_001465 [Chroococcidiopsis cubana SAG 39.79]|nr:hypothetical protein [Chroococcidiopsis cubana SAG 39.79]
MLGYREKELFYRGSNPTFVGSQKREGQEKDTVIFGACLYGRNWIVTFHECQVWVEELIKFIRNK